MVATEVEEDRDVEDDAVDPAHHQRVAGHLHRAGVDPRSRITANSACRSGASGVVSEVLTSSPAIRVPTVPIDGRGTPGPARPASAAGWWWSCPGCRSRRSSAGRRPGRRRRARRAARARARGSATTSSGTPGGTPAGPAGSVSTATAPAARPRRRSHPVRVGARQGGVQVARADSLRAERQPGDRPSRGRRRRCGRPPSASAARRRVSSGRVCAVALAPGLSAHHAASVAGVTTRRAGRDGLRRSAHAVAPEREAHQLREHRAGDRATAAAIFGAWITT